MLSHVLSYIAFINILTFLMYAYDKSAARRQRSRISENTLHCLALGGGWVGALFGQQLLRHKTVKQPFRFIFLMTVVVNTALSILWLST